MKKGKFTHTFDELCPHYDTGSSYVISGTGKDKVVGYRNGVHCNLGDIEIREWEDKVRTLIAEAEEWDLYDALYQHIKERFYSCTKRTQDIEHKALKHYAARIFDDPLWVDFIAFNARYRPEVLKRTELVSVKTACCKKYGHITKARFDASDKETFCPHCGRWSEIIGYSKRKS